MQHWPFKVLSCDPFCNLRETFHSFAVPAARNSRKIPPFDPKCSNIGRNGEKFITSLIFMRWRHSHMRAIFGYTPSQLRYTPKLKSIDHELLQISPFEVWPFNTPSRDSRWRHTYSKLVNTVSSQRQCVCKNFIEIEVCLIGKMAHTKPVYKVYGILVMGHD